MIDRASMRSWWLGPLWGRQELRSASGSPARRLAIRAIAARLGIFKMVTGLEVAGFDLLVSLGVFNATHMNQPAFDFRRDEDPSQLYAGSESPAGRGRSGLTDTVAVGDAP